MTLLYPLGLLGLLGIPVLVLIYIIKNKYTEQVIASTYLWRLSEKFLNKRIPINKLVGILSLLLQIFLVVLISLAISQPVFTIPNSANAYCFVLDGSGSMNIQTDGKTRFETGKDKIAEIIEKSNNGSEYSLIYVGDYTETVFKNVTNKEQALILLDRVSASYSVSSLEKSNEIAQEVFEKNPSVLTYLVTDKSFEQNENVNVINVSSVAENYALQNVNYTVSGELIVTGEVVSYESAATLQIQCKIDESEQPLTTVVEVEKAIPVSFEIKCSVSDFQTIEVVIVNEDALQLDNQIIIYSPTYENAYTTLLVSDEPFFMQAVLRTVGNTSVKTVSTSKYAEAGNGFGLYIFDTFTPDVLPSDGAVWFINPTSSVANSGFSVQREVGREDLNGDAKLQYSSSSSTLVQTLLNEVAQKDVTISRYIKCSQYLNFSTLLSCGGNPVVFTGTNGLNNLEVVFAFKLNDSTFTVMPDFLVLCSNLIDYLLPNILDKTTYSYGENLKFNAPANCDRVRITTPNGNTIYPDVIAINEYELHEVGTYTITTFATDNTQKDYSVFVSFPESERAATSVSEESYSLVGEAENKKLDGTFDSLIVLFILLAVVCVADWAVYCYEQYQLR